MPPVLAGGILFFGVPACSAGEGFDATNCGHHNLSVVIIPDKQSCNCRAPVGPGRVCQWHPTRQQRAIRGEIAAMMGKVSVAAVAALLTSAVVFSPAEAAVCKSSEVSALGAWSQTMGGARAKARIAWKKKTKAIYGPKWDTWWRSSSKSYGCWQYGSRERCRVKARPCRPGN